jgi:RNA 2',3'-cyclic 3'-phosphodiesterase
LTESAATTERLRAFVAIELAAGLREALGTLVGELRQEIRGVRWVAPTSIHLTLRFLGWSDPERLRRLEPKLRQAAAECAEGEARASSLGLFPERGAPRVLWVGLELPEPIQALQRACERLAVEEGFTPEARAFRPHLTLARFHDRAPRPRLPSFDFGATPLERLVLFRSELKPSGAVYTPMAVFPLRSAAS